MKINLAKFVMFQVGEVSMIQSLTNVLSCKVGCLPFSYLGLPLGAKFKSKVIWNLMMERISAWLNSWKAPLLSKCGRLILIKSVLASIPNYYLSLFTIPASVAKRIESNFRNFLWNDLEVGRKYHLVD